MPVWLFGNGSDSPPRLRHRWFFPGRLRFHCCRKRFGQGAEGVPKNATFHGNEIVAATRRLCLMNMFLHNIGEIDGESFISSTDALIADEGMRFDYILANPPFGKKSSITVTTEDGAGETVRKQFLAATDLHTILRLPTGVFYAQGVKANVLFFDNKPASKDPWTREVWIYDYQKNIHHTLKKNPLRLEHLKDFIECYNPSNRHTRTETWSKENPDGRWRKFSYEEIAARDKTNLDVFWLKDQSLADLDNLPNPDVLDREIVENLKAGLELFREILTIVGEEDEAG